MILLVFCIESWNFFNNYSRSWYSVCLPLSFNKSRIVDKGLVYWLSCCLPQVLSNEKLPGQTLISSDGVVPLLTTCECESVMLGLLARMVGCSGQRCGGVTVSCYNLTCVVLLCLLRMFGWLIKVEFGNGNENIIINDTKNSIYPIDN